MNVAGMINRINHDIKEELYSQSANSTNFNEHDIIRLKSYLANKVSYLDWCDSQPMLDLPESSPEEYGLAETVEVFPVANQMVTDVVNLMATLRTEVTKSQSASQGSTGFHPADSARIRAVVQAISDYIDNYVEQANPVDLPESHPSVPMIPRPD